MLAFIQGIQIIWVKVYEAGGQMVIDNQEKVETCCSLGIQVAVLETSQTIFTSTEQHTISSQKLLME